VKKVKFSKFYGAVVKLSETNIDNMWKQLAYTSYTKS